jgi:membrane protease YdiL (CAAX protease family)
VNGGNFCAIPHRVHYPLKNIAFSDHKSYLHTFHRIRFAVFQAPNSQFWPTIFSSITLHDYEKASYRIARNFKRQTPRLGSSDCIAASAIAAWGTNFVFTLPGQNIRYLYICIFLAALPLPMIVIEMFFIATDSGFSVFDGRGTGQITLYGAALLFVVIYSRYVAADSPFYYIDVYRKAWRRTLAGFATFALFSSTISAVAFAMTISMDTVTYTPENFEKLETKRIIRLFISLPIASVLALVEESMFRGFLMRYLRWKPSRWATILAVAFSSFVFAFVHNLSDPLSWIELDKIRLFIGLFILGCTLCTIYICTGSLWCSVGLHAGFLFAENARNYTKVLNISEAEWWMAVHQDVRTAPITWLLFALIGLGVYLLRHKLHPIYAVEKAVVANSDVLEPIERPKSRNLAGQQTPAE